MIGRQQERERLAAAVDAARSGRSAVLVVVGEPGIGKTVLLADAASYAAAAGLRVREARGVQAERDVPYAGLHALLGPLVTDDVLAGLPRVHAEALEVALGLRAGPGPTRLTIGAAVLGVLGAVEPVCLLVDDLQWLDPASVDALTFAARRLDAEPVALLCAVRVAEGGSFPPVGGLPVLRLEGLEDASGLLPAVAPTVAERLRVATGGNPLAMVEIASALSAEQVSGAAALPRELPVSDPEEMFAERLATLAADTRTAARVLALAGAAPRPVLDAAAVSIPVALDDLGRLGLTVPGRDTTWRHPLARSAAARGEPDEVRAAHTILAAAWATTRGGRDAPARAWHLAEAAQATDDEAAALLVAVAERSEAIGASADAADAWERAAELTTDQASRPVLVGRAARAALAAGATQRAAGLLDHALLHQASAEETARLLWLRGRVQHALGDPDRELDLFLQAVDLSRDPEVRVWAAAEGLLAAMYADRPDQASRMAALARAHHDPNDRTHRFLVAHAEGAAHALNHDATAAAAAMATARALLADGLLDDVPELLLWAVNLDLFDRRDPTTTPELYAALDRVRDSGDLTWLPRVTHLLAGREALTGHRAASDALLVEAELTSRLSGQHTQLLEALVARAEEDALRGDDEALAARLDEAVQVAARVGTRWLEDSLDDARMRAAMTRGEHAAVAALARSLLDSDPDLLAILVDAVRRTDGVEARSRRAGLPRRPPTGRARGRPGGRRGRSRRPGRRGRRDRRPAHGRVAVAGRRRALPPRGASSRGTRGPPEGGGAVRGSGSGAMGGTGSRGAARLGGHPSPTRPG